MTYELVDGGDVLMENNMPYKTIGIGSIKICMHGVVSTLANDRHVPKLKNLISLGKLDDNGYKYWVKVELRGLVKGLWLV